MQRELESFCRERRTLFYPKADLAVAGGVPRAPADLPALAADLCRDVFGAAPSAVALLGEAGTFHWLYRAAGPDGRSVVVRLNALSHLRRDFLLHLDAWAADRLRAAGLPALRVHAADTSRARCPYDFEIMDEARGTSLKALDDDEDRLRPALFALGRFVGRMHGIKTRGFGFFDVRPLVLGQPAETLCGLSPTWRTYVLRRLEAHVATCVRIGAIDPGEAGRIFAAFLASDHLLDDVEPALLHGDLGSHNVFTDGGDITAVIDWEDALSGDAVFDVAFWATFHPERRHVAFLDGYRSVRALPVDFAWRFWLYYLRVALAKTVLRHRLGIADRPGRPPASRRIQLALERVEAQKPLAA
jgi:hygromycin-B 4-O-kinase